MAKLGHTDWNELVKEYHENLKWRRYFKPG